MNREGETSGGRSEICYEWLVCLGTLLIVLVRCGPYYSFGMFVKTLNKEYGCSVALLTWIICLTEAIFYFCSPIPVAVRKKIKTNGNRKITLISMLTLAGSCLLTSFVTQPHWMFLTFSLVHGLSLCFLFMASCMTLMEYFPRDHKHHILASTFLYSGYPLSSLIYNPLTNYLISTFSWQNTFRLYSIIVVVLGVPLSCLYKVFFLFKNDPTLESLEGKKNEKKTNNNKNGMDFSDLKFVVRESGKRPEVACWWVANLITNILYITPFFLMPHYLKTKGFSEGLISLTMALLSVGEWFVYTLVALFGDKLKGKLIFVNIFGSFLLSIVLLLWIFLPFLPVLCIVLQIFYGIFVGVLYLFSYPCSAEATNLPLVMAWTSTNIFKGFGSLLMPLLTGALYDMSNNYKDVFISLLVLSCTCFLLFIIVFFFSSRNKKKLPTETVEEIEVKT